MEGMLGTKRGPADDLADAAVKLQKTDDTCVKSLRACQRATGLVCGDAWSAGAAWPPLETDHLPVFTLTTTHARASADFSTLLRTCVAAARTMHRLLNRTLAVTMTSTTSTTRETGKVRMVRLESSCRIVGRLASRWVR